MPRRPKILVVEDDPSLRLFVVGRLNHLGFTALTAEAADEALAIIEKHPEVTLLFTDIVLAGQVDGLDLAESARALRPDLKLIFTSGYAPENIKHKVGPGEHVLPKPFTGAALEAKLRQVLDF
jgi:CheY-like chemotaxis protein